MPSAFNGTAITSVEQDLFNATTDGGTCESFEVRAGPQDIVVNVSGLHAADQWFPIAAFGSQEFTYAPDGISRVRCKLAPACANATNGTAGGGITERRDAPNQPAI